MTPNRTFTLLLASALYPLMAFSALNGYTASGKTVRTSYPLEGKDSIVTKVDGKIVSIEIVQKENDTKNADKKEVTADADTMGLAPGAGITATTLELEHQYRMQQLENEHEMAKLKLKSQENAAKINSTKSQYNPYKQTIAVLLICIGLPLLLAFGFLSYRLRLKNKRCNDFEKFLTDLAQSGQPISPELVYSLRATQLSGTTGRNAHVRPKHPTPEAGADAPAIDEEGLKLMEKETFRYCTRRACLAATTLLLIFWALISGIDMLGTLLVIPFLIFLFQGGVRFFDYYVEKRYRTPAAEIGTSPVQSADTPQGTMSDPQPAQPLPAETPATDITTEPTR